MLREDTIMRYPTPSCAVPLTCRFKRSADSPTDVCLPAGHACSTCAACSDDASATLSLSAAPGCASAELCSGLFCRTARPLLSLRHVVSSAVAGVALPAVAAKCLEMILLRTAGDDRCNTERQGSRLAALAGAASCAWRSGEPRRWGTHDDVSRILFNEQASWPRHKREVLCRKDTSIATEFL